jgi:transposase
MQSQLEDIEREIKERVNKDEELKAKAKVIKSVKSVGEKTTMTLLAAMPELGNANRREIAALAGLAPIPRHAVKQIKNEEHRLEDLLSNVCSLRVLMVAVRNNKDLKDFYEKLIKNGKLKNCCPCCCYA